MTAVNDNVVASIAEVEGGTAQPPRPYGLLGLAVSLIVIQIVAILLCLLAAGLVFGVASLLLGWREALDRFNSLREVAGSESLFLQRAGVIVSLVFYAAFAATVIGAARLRGGSYWRHLIAWRPWHPLRGAGLFWIVSVATIAYSLVADEVISRLYPPSSEWIVLPTGRVWAGLFIMLAVLFAPVAEEILFRGWLYTGLREKIGVWPGILTTSVLFALAHWEKTHIYALAVFPVGLALGFDRERTGSLKASMTLHALYNATASVLLVLGL